MESLESFLRKRKRPTGESPSVSHLKVARRDEVLTLEEDGGAEGGDAEAEAGFAEWRYESRGDADAATEALRARVVVLEREISVLRGEPDALRGCTERELVAAKEVVLVAATKISAERRRRGFSARLASRLDGSAVAMAVAAAVASPPRPPRPEGGAPESG